MIPRFAAQTALEKAKHYPVLAITGPRQSGKSTLARMLFPDKPYISLEDWDVRQFAMEDPRSFLGQFQHGAIIDEAQHVPALFSYLQTIVDTKQINDLFVLTGSQQFGFVSKITQSLAGRVGFIQLLPFTLPELQQSGHAPDTVEELLFKGLYPPIYDRKISSQSWYSDYIMTYVERDVRQLINIQDLRTFHNFLKMCAARTGQLLNLSSLANDCGITHNTAKAWLSVLEASYITYTLSPHHVNFNKRIVKSPKLYFHDTGLACTLLDLQNASQLITHPMRGALFETWVLSEFVKARFNKGLLANLYFWRDSQGHEIDILSDQGQELVPIEVKSGQTISTDYFSGLRYWCDLNKQDTPAWLIYAGEQNQTRNNMTIRSWRQIGDIL